MNFFRYENLKRLAAILLLAMPLAAYPLVFYGSLAGRQFSLVRAVTPEIIGIFSLGVVCAFPERVLAFFRQKGFWGKIVVLSGIVLLTGSAVRVFSSDAAVKWTTALFYTALPLACIAVGEELKKFLSTAMILFGILAVFYGVISPHGEGLLLNWNWNSTVIALGIGAALCRFLKGAKSRKLLIAALAFGAFFALAYFWRGDYFSRGSWFALVAATASVALWTHFPVRRRGIFTFCAVALLTALFFFLPQKFPEKYDCRVQLWRGTHDLIARNVWCGVGAGNFEDRIQEKLPLQYYFSPLPAPRHTHPHNEMLFFLAVFGIAGSVFLASLLAVAAQTSSGMPAAKWLLWSCLVLFFHAQVDVLLAETLPGVLFYATLGALIEVPASPYEKGRLPRMVFLGGATVLAFFLAGRTLLGTISYREAAARFREHLSCGKSLRRALRFYPEPRTLYLAGMEKARRGEWQKAEAYFEEIHRRFHLGGYFHSNHMAGCAAMAAGRYRNAAEFFAREELRYPVSIVNAVAMAVLARKMDLPPELQRQAQQKVDELLRLRGKTPADLADFIRRPALDDTLRCVKTGIPAPEPPSKP